MPFSFSMTLVYSVPLVGLVEEGGTWVWVSLASSAFLETGSAWELGEVGGLNARIAEGGGVIDIFYFPKRRRGLNLSLIECLVPHLEAVCPTYPHDLGPKCLLSLSYPHIVAVLFSLVLSLLNLFKLLF